ncbi:MAG: lysoplasmalogenase [Coriobacteriia bacterium]
MNGSAIPFCILTASGVAAALVAARADRTLWYAAAKLAASAGFVGVAFTVGAAHATWSQIVAAGLVLASIGDLVLGARTKRSLPIGMACFAAAYAAYAVGFTSRGMSIPAAAVGAAVATIVGGTAWVLLYPRVPSILRIPVSIYIAITTIMLAAGIATGATRQAWALVAGVVLVALSDGAVGAERFGERSLAIKAVGLPAYYLGQILIAVSLAG